MNLAKKLYDYFEIEMEEADLLAKEIRKDIAAELQHYLDRFKANES